MPMLIQPPLPADATSALLIARDQIVGLVEEWSVNFRRGRTIGHAGQVTAEFIRKQANRAPRSIITVLSGDGERIAGGSMTQLPTRFIWFLIVNGTLEDRTNKGLLLSGEGTRFVWSSPWLDIEGSAFVTTPTRVGFRSLYQDKDEKNGISIWSIDWDQAVDMGTATRPDLIPAEPLEQLDGTYTVEGEPDNDTVTVTITEDP